MDYLNTRLTYCNPDPDDTSPLMAENAFESQQWELAVGKSPAICNAVYSEFAEWVAIL